MTLTHGRAHRAAYSWGIDWDTPGHCFLWLMDYCAVQELGKDLHNALTEIAMDIRPMILTDVHIVFRDTAHKWQGVHIVFLGTEAQLVKQYAPVVAHKAISTYVKVEIIRIHGDSLEQAKIILL